MAKHEELTSIHLGAYAQAGDPGAVGAHKLWVDTSVGPPYDLKKRNAADDGWELVGIAGRKGILGITIGSWGSGIAITTGIKGGVEVPEDCEIVGWTIVADQVGSIVVDVWKDTYANYPPTVADTIAGAEKPTLAAADKNQDLALGTWTTACTEGDWIFFNVDSVATVQWVCVTLRVVYGTV